MRTNIKLIALVNTQASLLKRTFVIGLSTTLLLIVLLWAQNIWAHNSGTSINKDPAVQKEAANFIQKLADKTLTSLNEKDVPLAAQEARFRDILKEGFDVKYIGKISLGRHSTGASAQNLKTYYDIFPNYLVKVYTSRLTKLDTKSVTVGDVLPNGKKDMYVRTKVIDSENKSYDVDWRVRIYQNDDKTTKTYKIIDIKIEGISMARTQRDDFASKINKSGLGALLSFMQSIINETTGVEETNNVKTVKK